MRNENQLAFPYIHTVNILRSILLLCLLLCSTMAAPSGRSAAVLGATGAVGKEIVKSLLARNWTSVTLLNRRPTKDLFPKDGRIVEMVVPMENGEVNGALQQACERIFREQKTSSLFIAMGVGAPSKTTEEVVRRVDLHLPSACVRGAKSSGIVQHVSILTAVGADVAAVPATSDALFGLIPRTRASGGLYNHLKGKIEENIKALDFQTASTFRPATLIGTPNTPG